MPFDLLTAGVLGGLGLLSNLRGKKRSKPPSQGTPTEYSTLTPEQQALSTKLFSMLGGGEQGMGMLDPTQAFDFYKKYYMPQELDFFTQNIMPKIRESFIGEGFSGSNRANAESQAWQQFGNQELTNIANYSDKSLALAMQLLGQPMKGMILPPGQTTSYQMGGQTNTLQDMISSFAALYPILNKGGA